jgi:ribosomal protein S18 acetylase RimI-like enzyme
MTQTIHRSIDSLTDLEALVNLINSCADVYQTNDHTTPEDLQAELSDPELDLAQSARLWQTQGEVVALALLSLSTSTTELEASLWFRIHPNARETALEDAVFAWAIDQTRTRQRELQASHASLNSGARADQTALLALLQRQGLLPVRYSVDLHCPLPTTNNSQLPANYTLRPLAPERDAADWVALYNTVLHNEPMFAPATLEQFWDNQATSEVDLVLSNQHGTLVGFGQATRDDFGRGIIQVFGVHPEERGQGLGRALLGALVSGLQTLKASGAWISLTIDRLEQLAWYEQLGFTRVYTLVVCSYRV